MSICLSNFPLLRGGVVCLVIFQRGIERMVFLVLRGRIHYMGLTWLWGWAGGEASAGKLRGMLRGRVSFFHDVLSWFNLMFYRGSIVQLLLGFLWFTVLVVSSRRFRWQAKHGFISVCLLYLLFRLISVPTCLSEITSITDGLAIDETLTVGSSWNFSYSSRLKKLTSVSFSASHD